MPIGWIIALLLGGAALVSMGGSEDSSINGTIDDVKAAMERSGYKWTEGKEKFLDPRSIGFRLSDSIDSSNPFKVGSLDSAMAFYNKDAPSVNCNYLNYPVVGDALLYIGESPAFASKRIAKLKEKVYSIKGDSPSLSSIAGVSDIALEKSVLNLYKDLKNPKNWSKLADEAGIPVSAISDWEKGFETKINSWTKKYARVDITSLFVAAKAEIGKLLETSINKVSKELATTFGSSANSLSASVAGMLPILGAAWDMFVKAKDIANEAYRLSYETWLQYNVLTPFKQSNAKGYIFPWHIKENWDMTPSSMESKPGSYRPTADQVGAANDYIYSLLMMSDLEIADKFYIVNWWALSLSLMADEKVYSVFNAMGRNRGLFASDEQVLAVAAPIAVKNGWDVFKFAELLWGFDPGWSRGDIPSRQWKVDKVSEKEWIEVDGGWVGKGGTKPIFLKITTESGHSISNEVIPSYANIPMNAWALNFVSLCRTAEDLEKLLKKYNVSLSPAIEKGSSILDAAALTAKL